MASQESLRNASQSSTAGGVYDRLLVFDSTDMRPILKVDANFTDSKGRTLEEIFRFTPTRTLTNTNRIFRAEVFTPNDSCKLAIFCRVENKVTAERLEYEMNKINHFFRNISSKEDRYKLYINLVDTYYEKMVMSLDYPPKDPNLNKWLWKKYDSINLRRHNVDIHRTDDETSVSGLVYRLLPAQGTSGSASDFMITHRSQQAARQIQIISSTPITSRETTPVPDAVMKGFKPPGKSDARKTRATTTQQANQEQIGQSSAAPTEQRGLDLRAGSEAPSEILAGNINADHFDQGIGQVKAMLTDIMNLIYDESRRAAKDENGKELAAIREEIEGLKTDIANINTKLGTLYTLNQKSSKAEFANDIGKVLENQKRIEKKLHNLGYTMAEKEAVAVKMIGRIFPIDQLNEAVDIFLANSFVQDMILKYLKPSIDGVSFHELDKGIANAILTKLFTQNCRAHMVVGETPAGLANKMWCKRGMPSFCIKVIDSLVLPYLSKKLKGEARDQIIQKNVAEVTSRMQVTLCGDRTAFLRRAAAACKTGDDAIQAMWEEDCRFYDANKHAIVDEKPTFEEYYEATKNLTPIKKLFELEERGLKESKKKVYPAPGHVFDTLRIREGQALTCVQDVVELIASAYTAMGGEIKRLHFDPVKTIPDMKERTDEALAAIKEDIGDVVKKWLATAVEKPTTSREQSESVNSEDEFVTPEDEGRKRKRGAVATSSRSIKKARSQGVALTPRDNPNESRTPSTSSTDNTRIERVSPPLTRGRKDAKKKPKRSLFVQSSDNEDQQEGIEISHEERPIMEVTKDTTVTNQPAQIEPPAPENMHNTDDEEDQ